MSSNAPAILLDAPPEFIASMLVPHMGVVLASMYGTFLVPD